MFAYLGAFLVIASWLAGIYLIRTWRGTHAMSISEHAASAQSASRLFAVVLVGVGGTFCVWIYKWFIPHLQLGATFEILLFLALTALIITGLIPDSSGWRKKVHRLAAFFMAVLYIPMGILIVHSGATAGTAKIICIICLAYMVSAVVGYLIFKQTRANYLIAQSLYIFAFQIIIMSAAYL